MNKKTGEGAGRGWLLWKNNPLPESEIPLPHLPKREVSGKKDDFVVMFVVTNEAYSNIRSHAYQEQKSAGKLQRSSRCKERQEIRLFFE